MTFTVGITNYNYARFLPQAIETALEQADEVIVVDDCSTDNSRDVIAEYPVTAILHEENTGTLVTGRREVIAAANCDYILHLDADDYLMPAALKTFRDYMTPETDWAFGNLAVVDEMNRVQQVWDYAGWPTTQDACLTYARERLTTPISMKGVFRRDWLLEHDLSWYHFDTTYFGEDCLTALKYLEHDPRIVHVPVLTIGYRKHADQMTTDDRERQKFKDALAEYLGG